MESVLISVIVPAYNVENYIVRTLDSLLRQTYANLEIIVIDDGSTDGTGLIIDNYVARDSRIVCVHQRNKGLVCTREVGIQLAKGAYIGFVDADDIIDEDMYERLLRNAVAHQADISHCGMLFCLPDGTEEKHGGQGIFRVMDCEEGQKALLTGKEIEPSLCNKLYRRELLQNSCLDVHVVNNEDLLRNAVLFQRAKCSVYDDFCGYHYLQRDGSMSRTPEKGIQAARHIVHARELIVENSSAEIYPYAVASLFSAVITAVNTYTFEKDPVSEEYYQECLKYLREHKNEKAVLPLKKKVIIFLMLYTPQLHRLIYTVYKKRKYG